MNLNLFFTQQLQNFGQAGQVPTLPNLQVGEGTGEGETNIFDLLIAQILENTGETKPQEGEVQEALTSDNPVLDKEPKLDIAELLAANPGIEEEIEAFVKSADLGLIEEIQTVLNLNQNAFDTQILPVTPHGGIDAENLAVLEDGEFAVLKDIIQFIQAPKPEAAKATEKTPTIEGFDLTKLNLTPEEITVLQELEQPETVQEFVEFIATIQNVVLKATEKPVVDTELPPEAAIVALAVQQPQPANQNKPEIATRLNALITGDQGDDALRPAALPRSDFGGLEAKPEIDGAPDKNIGKKAAGAPEINIKQGQQQSAAQNNFSALPPSFTTLLDSALASPSLIPQDLAEALGLSISGVQNGTYAAPTALLTQSAQAGQAHPATHLVAASLQKAGLGGENTQISLQLDPPDLGRVDVRLQFGKEKTVKTVIRVENQDTFHMLQRDVQTLERALQDAGLDTDGGIGFELAEDGNFMDHNNQRGGGHEQGGTGAGEDELEEIIESTMTWHVDPESGHMRYDILV